CSVRNFHVVVMVLMAARLAALLKCHQGGVVAATKGEVEGNFCLYYELYPSLKCETFNQLYGFATLNTTMLNRKCGGFWEGSNVIAACFCNFDYCNHIDQVKQFIDNSINEPSIITDVLTWKVIKDSKTQRSLVECLRDNMRSITRTEDLSDAHAVAIVIVYITIASLACICIVAVYRSPDRHARETVPKQTPYPRHDTMIESPERPPSK
ncbi:hypothetical protein V3C99_016925, partial [Haemonchus contortus]